MGGGLNKTPDLLNHTSALPVTYNCAISNLHSFDTSFISMHVSTCLIEPKGLSSLKLGNCNFGPLAIDYLNWFTLSSLWFICPLSPPNTILLLKGRCYRSWKLRWVLSSPFLSSGIPSKNTLVVLLRLIPLTSWTLFNISRSTSSLLTNSVILAPPQEHLQCSHPWWYRCSHSSENNVNDCENFQFFLVR